MKATAVACYARGLFRAIALPSERNRKCFIELINFLFINLQSKIENVANLY
jgi:hypothetical protein